MITTGVRDVPEVRDVPRVRDVPGVRGAGGGRGCQVVFGRTASRPGWRAAASS